MTYRTIFFRSYKKRKLERHAGNSRSQYSLILFLQYFLLISFQFLSNSREVKMFLMSINKKRRVKVNVILLVCAWTLSVTLVVPLMVKNGGVMWNRADGDEASWMYHLCPHYHTKPEAQDTLSWRPPSAQDIFFTQTSCAVALSIREVNIRNQTLTKTSLFTSIKAL